jgi:hypothetical protein
MGWLVLMRSSVPILSCVLGVFVFGKVLDCLYGFFGEMRIVYGRWVGIGRMEMHRHDYLVTFS